MGDDPGEDGSSDGSGGSSNADHRADARRWEHVGRGREEVRGPTLMRGGGEAEERNRGPGVIGEEIVHVRHKHDGKDTESADEHGELASGVDAVSVLHAEAGEPAACDRSDAGDGVDDDERVLDVVEIEPVVIVEELREIEEVEPPDGIGESLSDTEGPEAAMAHQDGVDWLSLGDGREVGLGLGQSATQLVVGEEQPDDAPDEPHGAGRDKGGVPSPAHGDGGDKDRSDEGGGVGAGVEEAGGEGSFFRGEPLGSGLDGGGEVSGFAEAEEDAGDAEADYAADERVADGGASPDENGEGIAGLGAEPVDDATGEEEADAVGDLKADQDAAVINVVDSLMSGVDAGDPAHEAEVQERLDEREDRAVHVIDGRGKKEKKADKPPDIGAIGGLLRC